MALMVQRSTKGGRLQKLAYAASLAQTEKPRAQCVQGCRRGDYAAAVTMFLWTQAPRFEPPEATRRAWGLAGEGGETLTRLR